MSTFLAGALTAGAAFGQAPVAAFAAGDVEHASRLLRLGLDDRLAWQLVQSLVTEVGPRPAGSAADAKAVQWALAACRRAGLSAVRAEPVALKVWQRGPASARLIAPRTMPLVMAALGNSVAAPAGGIEAEVAWYPDFAALVGDGSTRAQGRIVFIDQKTERTRDGRGYVAAVQARSSGAIEAARRGAVAVAIRSIGTGREPIAHTGAMRYDLRLPRIPAFAVSVPDADAIASLVAAGGAPLRMRLELAAREGVEATSHNVIAEIAGTDLAGEVVLIGAHLDSWDLGPGALDDGAGVAITLAAAALLRGAGRAPRRTVRLVLFANEENGFDGANAYAQAYGDVPHQMVGESDFGSGRIHAVRSRVRPEALPLIDTLASLLAPLGVERPAEAPNEASPGPDAALLMRRQRWPAVQLAQDGSAYFDVHHTEHDTLDRIDPATLPQNVACWAAVAWLAAQSPLRW